MNELVPNVSYFEALSIFLSSAVVCAALVYFATRIKIISGCPDDLESIQSAHSRITPRVGGIAIFLTISLGLAFSPSDVFLPYAKFLAIVTLLFCVGLAEDLRWHVSAKVRLLTAGIAGLLVALALDAWVPRLGWDLLDPIMANGMLGVPLTVFAVAGISNGFNLIDGVNGLAGLTGLVSALSLMVISSAAGYDAMVTYTAILALGICGFLVLNFPMGQIFLGDSGAYSLGFVLSWFGVAIMLEAPAATPWAILLTMFWPIADTLLAIFRRSSAKKPSMKPDRLHVHQLVMRGLEIFWLGRRNRHISNPLTTVLLAPLIITPALLGVALWDRPVTAFWAFWALIALFFIAYSVAAHIIQAGRRRPTLRSAAK